MGGVPKEQIKKEGEYMFSNENRTVTKIKSNTRIFLGVIHLVFAFYLAFGAIINKSCLIAEQESRVS